MTQEEITKIVREAIQAERLAHLKDDAKFQTSVANGVIRAVTTNLEKGVQNLWETINRTDVNRIAELLPTKRIERDEEGNVAEAETIDGILPMLTIEELTTLKAFLADYAKIKMPTA